MIILILTTLEEETQLTVELQEFDRLQEFESAVLEQLPEIGESSSVAIWLKVFGSNPPDRWAGGSRNFLKEKRLSL